MFHNAYKCDTYLYIVESKIKENVQTFSDGKIIYSSKMNILDSKING